MPLKIIVKSSLCRSQVLQILKSHLRFLSELYSHPLTTMDDFYYLFLSDKLS